MWWFFTLITAANSHYHSQALRWSTRQPAAHDPTGRSTWQPFSFPSFFSVRAAKTEVGVAVCLWSRCWRPTGTQDRPLRRIDSSPAASWRLHKHKQTRKTQLASAEPTNHNNPSTQGERQAETVDAERAVRALWSSKRRGSGCVLYW